jgi:plastocyanin
LIALTGSEWTLAGELTVRVSDNEGQPVANIAVFVEQAGVDVDTTREPATAIMDQRDARFVPHILVVEKGAAVEFPNSDIVAHHVYSFSRPNNFVLPLYKGTPPAPVTFEHDGVVILGCNIHDGMLAYVVVVDSSVFGITDENGVVVLAVDDEASDFEVNIWSPRIRDSRDPITQRVSAVPNATVSFDLKKSLRPAHVDQTGSVAWDEY